MNISLVNTCAERCIGPERHESVDTEVRKTIGFQKNEQPPICIGQPAFVGASAIFDFPRLGRNAHSRNRKMLPR